MNENKLKKNIKKNIKNMETEKEDILKKIKSVQKYILLNNKIQTLKKYKKSIKKNKKNKIMIGGANIGTVAGQTVMSVINLGTSMINEINSIFNIGKDMQSAASAHSSVPPNSPENIPTTSQDPIPDPK